MKPFRPGRTRRRSSGQSWERYPETVVAGAMGATFFSLDPSRAGRTTPRSSRPTSTKGSAVAVDRARLAPSGSTSASERQRSSGSSVEATEPDYAVVDTDPPPPRLREAALDLDRQPERGRRSVDILLPLIEGGPRSAGRSPRPSRGTVSRRGTGLPDLAPAAGPVRCDDVAEDRRHRPVVELLALPDRENRPVSLPWPPVITPSGSGVSPPSYRKTVTWSFAASNAMTFPSSTK